MNKLWPWNDEHMERYFCQLREKSMDIFIYIFVVYGVKLFVLNKNWGALWTNSSMLDYKHGKPKPVTSWKHWLPLFPDHSDEKNHQSLIAQIHSMNFPWWQISKGYPWPIFLTYFFSTSSMRAGSPRVRGWLWLWRRSTSCLRALSSRLRDATSFSSKRLSLSAMLIVSGSPAKTDSFMESSTDSSQASKLPRAWSTFTTCTEQTWRGWGSAIYVSCYRSFPALISRWFNAQFKLPKALFKDNNNTWK